MKWLIICSIIGIGSVWVFTNMENSWGVEPPVTPYYYQDRGFKIFKTIDGKFEYSIPYQISNGKINSIYRDCSLGKLGVNIESNSNGTLKINSPLSFYGVEKGLFDFSVEVDGQETEFKERKENFVRKFTIKIRENSSKISIYGSSDGTANPKMCDVLDFPRAHFENPIPPKKQIANEILPNEIVCKPGMDLIFKQKDGSPACVGSSSAKKLMVRGWIDVPSNQTWKFVPIGKYIISVCRGTPCPIINQILPCGLGNWLKNDGELASYQEQWKLDLGFITKEIGDCK